MNDIITDNLSHCVDRTDLPYPKHEGKARDIYTLNDHLLIISTDRVSGFDRHLSTIPFKGQVLNQLSAWWFGLTQHIVANHMVRVLDPYSMLAKKCDRIPIEVVVRGFLTGTTKTSIWTLYQQGQREFFGQKLPEGLVKNEALPEPIITPTTKSHSDEALNDPEQLCAKAGISEKDWQTIQDKALKLFELGQRVAHQHGLILVDTKYEFGWDKNGKLTLIDELHTPDSSRFWPQDHIKENYDKEFLRQWFHENSLPYQQTTLPEVPDELRTKMAKRYIYLYERLTGESFNFERFDQQRLKSQL